MADFAACTVATSHQTTAHDKAPADARSYGDHQHCRHISAATDSGFCERGKGGIVVDRDREARLSSQKR
jgi:hypothetical protein